MSESFLDTMLNNTKRDDILTPERRQKIRKTFNEIDKLAPQNFQPFFHQKAIWYINPHSKKVYRVRDQYKPLLKEIKEVGEKNLEGTAK